jgi:hypothetical protein
MSGLLTTMSHIGGQAGPTSWATTPGGGRANSCTMAPWKTGPLCLYIRRLGRSPQAWEGQASIQLSQSSSFDLVGPTGILGGSTGSHPPIGQGKPLALTTLLSTLNTSNSQLAFIRI